jgi:oligoribonuclease NrnB/cAMP/cGMP phosphodiesterase (DHH superfamily)
METSSRPLVLFHDQCVDGVVSAWIAWRRYFDQAEYLPVRYGEQPPDCADRLVFILDFSYPPSVMSKIADQASRCIVIDHHDSAVWAYQREWLERHDVVTVFDLAHSGAQLTARYFNASARLWIVDYAEDQDLWKFSLPDSKEVNALIAATCLGLPPLEAFQALEELRGRSMKLAVQQGRGALLQVQAYARQVASEAKRVTFAGYPNIPIVNCAKPFNSQVGHALNRDSLFSVSWRQEGDRAVFSLRSEGEPPFDCAKLCERFKGGGHRGAAGFALPFNVPAAWAEVFTAERG